MFIKSASGYSWFSSFNCFLLEASSSELIEDSEERWDTLAEAIFDLYEDEAYESKAQSIIKNFEKSISLAIIDEEWKEHLREMDDLKQSVQSAVYEQKDPLIIYKMEAYEVFRQMLGRLNRDISNFIFNTWR